MSVSAAEIAVHRIVAGAWAQNCYVVAADNGDAVIVDPGGKAELIADRVAADELRVRAVLATHGHYDHVGALGELVERYEVPFGIHSAEQRALTRVNFHRFALHKLEPVGIPAIDIDLAATAALRLGALELAVVHTPGHSPGSVCFEIAGMLFTGDALMAAESVGLPGFDPALLEASERRLSATYPPDTVIYPGHGDPDRLCA